MCSVKMSSWIFILCILAIAEQGCASNSTNIYDNHTLVQLYPENDEHIEALSRLGAEHKFEVLKSSRGVNDSTDILVPPGKMAVVNEFAKARNLTRNIKANYGRSFESSAERVSRRSFHAYTQYQYHSFAAISTQLEDWANKDPEFIKLQTLGVSFQGRRMKLAKISSNPKAGNPIIFIDAGIHAREWVAPALAMYLISRLVSLKGREELEGIDWYILPVVNPDGYEYSRSSSSNRLWRKTRSKTQSSHCYGVDGNRNFGYKWGVSGVSKNPCDFETYAGPKPFSEVETKMVRNVMFEYKDRIKLYVSLHSYGNYLVYPWGYTGDILPKKWKKMDALARAVSGAIQEAGGDPMKVMSAGKWYAAAGGSDDFAFAEVGIPYAYTMELTGGYEFNFPERKLRYVLPQYYEGFKVFARQIRHEFRRPRSLLDNEYNNNI